MERMNRADLALMGVLAIEIVLDVLIILDGLGIALPRWIVADPYDPLDIQARALIGGRWARKTKKHEEES